MGPGPASGDENRNLHHYVATPFSWEGGTTEGSAALRMTVVPSLLGGEEGHQVGNLLGVQRRAVGGHIPAAVQNAPRQLVARQ